MARQKAHDEPGAGQPLHNRFDADRAAVLDHHSAAGGGTHMLTSSRPGTYLGSGDQRPPVLRPGSSAAGQLPSRMGATLRWPDGRVMPVVPPPAPAEVAPVAEPVSPQLTERDEAAEFCAQLAACYGIDPSEF